MNNPSPPDPVQTANAQFGQNVNSSVANAWLGNANQSTPQGTWTNRATSYRKIGGARVPQFTQTFKFRPGQQQLFNQQQQLGKQMNGIAGRQLGRLNSSLSQPIDFSGAPELNGDFSGYQNEVEQGMLSRLQPQWDRDEEATRTRLANQGLTQGSEAWREEMDRLGRGVNDSRIQTMLASGGEARAAGGYQNQARQQYINELMSQRNQPLNEISALMSGGQVAQPGTPNWSSYAVAAPDLAGNIYANYGAQQQQNNAMMGGASSALGMLAGGFF